MVAKKKEPKQKKPRAAKVEAAPKPAKAAPKIFNNDDPEAKALFLQHRPTIQALRKAVSDATNLLRTGYKKAKAHGFDKVDFDYANEVETAEAEAKARAKIARRLVIARFMGSDLGAQLDMFLEPDRTPASDRAYTEGQTASMQNQPAKPSYAPETEQFRRYMEGFHAHQEKVAAGIGKLHPAVAEDVKATKNQKAKVDKQKAEDAEKFDDTPVTSGTPMTRAEFEAAQQQSHFQKA